ncbi:MAG: ABC transporter permease [Alphaproteobacteria bacterium]|nr:ABC transporter permease [Alphaproteobacteria bacterium]
MNIRRPASSVFAQVWARGAGRVGLVLVLLIVAMALFAPWIAPYAPNKINVANRFADPSGAFFMGTDHLGRDLFSRVLFGAQIAIVVAFAVISISLISGTLLGIAAAYAPARVERFFLIVFDVIASFPSLVLALAMVAILGPSLANVIAIVAITFIPHFGRVARAQVLALRNAPFLEASRAIGVSGPRLVFVHIIPNISGPLIVLASMDVPVVITIEAGLSFLGVGVRPPLASWGTLLYDGYSYLTQSFWPVLFAGLVLSLATLGFTLFGEALRDAIDPKLRRIP